MVPRVLQLGEGKRGAPGTPDASGTSPGRPGPKRVHVHAEHNTPMGGSPSLDKVHSQRIEGESLSSDKGCSQKIDVLEGSGSDSDGDENEFDEYRKKQLLDLMHAASCGNLEAQEILRSMGFTPPDRDDG